MRQSFKSEVPRLAKPCLGRKLNVAGLDCSGSGMSLQQWYHKLLHSSEVIDKTDTTDASPKMLQVTAESGTGFLNGQNQN